MKGLVLEAAADEDAEALCQLETRCHSHPWSLRHFDDALADPRGSRILVLRSPGRAQAADRGIVAYCVLQIVTDEIHVHNLAVRPEDRRRGHGRWLLEQALAWGRSVGARTALLEVRQSNWAALELYRAAGFAAISVRRGYYDHPREDALVLRKEELLHS
jgi:ribosomal-protein-alanine N-acetyltransferase